MALSFESKAENRQDLDFLSYYKAYSQLFPKKYIDIGANDGIKYSNTYILEQLGFTGYCLEADKYAFEELKKNRKCNCLNVALDDKESEVDFIHNGNSSLASKIWESKKDEFLVLCGAENKREGQEIYKIDTKLFDNVIPPGFYAFLSIDTEGREFKILSSINFDNYKFLFICVEVKFYDGSRDREKIHKLLTSNGYKFLGENEQDDYYGLF